MKNRVQNCLYGWHEARKANSPWADLKSKAVKQKILKKKKTTRSQVFQKSDWEDGDDDDDEAEADEEEDEEASAAEADEEEDEDENGGDSNTADDDDDDDDDDEADDEDGGSESNWLDLKKFEAGWHDEMGLGWRLPIGSNKNSQKEFSLAPNPQPADAGPLVVEFLDGCKAEMPMTIAAYLATKSTRASGGSEVLLEAEHVETHHKITVRQKRDRQLLICMFDQGRQVMQIRAERFGPVEKPVDDGQGPPTLPPESSVLDAANIFYKPLLHDYSMNRMIDKPQLYKARAARAAELNISLTSRGTKEKVAKQPTDETQSDAKKIKLEDVAEQPIDAKKLADQPTDAKPQKQKSSGSSAVLKKPAAAKAPAPADVKAAAAQKKKDDGNEADDKEAEENKIRLDTVMDRVKLAHRSTDTIDFATSWETLGDDLTDEFGFW